MTDSTEAAPELMALAGRLRRLRLGRHDPESYFVERDEIAAALVRLAHRLASRPSLGQTVL